MKKMNDRKTASASSLRAADTDFYTEEVVMAHSTWIASHPEGTLQDLREFLDSVLSELQEHDSDDLIADHIDDLGDAADYLADFEDPSKPVVGDDLPNFDYRVANVDEDIMNVDELIDLVGESFSVADLPSREEFLKPSSLKLVC